MEIAAVASATGEEEELRLTAKASAPRKLARFLDASSYAPFAATSAAFDQLDGVDPAGVALYSMSSWDGDMPDQPFLSDGTRTGDAALSEQILGDANPVTWLRMLSNNPLCQVSIARGFRGPNAHFVGRVDALDLALAAAEDDLGTGAAEAVILVAYEPAPEDRERPSGSALSQALAVGLVPGGSELRLAGDGDRTALEALTHLASADGRNEVG